MSRVRNAVIAGASVLLATGMLSQVSQPAVAAEAVVKIPAPAYDPAVAAPQAVAVFAGGCFWGVQGVYSHVNGVKSAVSGYAGGTKDTADYETVSGGNTGHAESVRVVYDPRVVSYGKLLQIFFSVVADPTTLNYQGPDHGTQYRTALFPTTPEQKLVAQRYIAQLGKSGAWKRPIVTKIEAATAFYPAEDYHQDFLAKNPNHPYIAINDMPKVAALKQVFAGQYRDKPVLVASR